MGSAKQMMFDIVLPCILFAIFYSFGVFVVPAIVSQLPVPSNTCSQLVILHDHLIDENDHPLLEPCGCNTDGLCITMAHDGSWGYHRIDVACLVSNVDTFEYSHGNQTRICPVWADSALLRQYVCRGLLFNCNYHSISMGQVFDRMQHQWITHSFEFEMMCSKDESYKMMF